MARLHYNGVSTTLGGSLTNVATSVTFAAALTHSAGTQVATISSDYLPLTILDSSGNLSEIVYLTAYTAGATTGTITRAQEGTTGVAHSSGDKVIHSTTVLDFRNTKLTVQSSDVSFTDTAQHDLLSFTFTPTGTSVDVEFMARTGNSTAGAYNIFRLLRDGTTVTPLASAVFTSAGAQQTTGCQRIITGLTSGQSYTFTLQVTATLGTVTARSSQFPSDESASVRMTDSGV